MEECSAESTQAWLRLRALRSSELRARLAEIHTPFPCKHYYNAHSHKQSYILIMNADIFFTVCLTHTHTVWCVWSPANKTNAAAGDTDAEPSPSVRPFYCNSQLVACHPHPLHLFSFSPLISCQLPAVHCLIKTKMSRIQNVEWFTVSDWCFRIKLM